LGISPTVLCVEAHLQVADKATGATAT
jgi:hypothetical protein